MAYGSFLITDAHGGQQDHIQFLTAVTKHVQLAVGMSEIHLPSRHATFLHPRVSKPIKPFLVQSPYGDLTQRLPLSRHREQYVASQRQQKTNRHHLHCRITTVATAMTHANQHLISIVQHSSTRNGLEEATRPTPQFSVSRFGS